MTTAPTARPSCARCRRPLSACWCAEVVPLPTATRIVILQHPRESRVAIGTARMAHLGLATSELHEGMSFEAHPRVQELARQAGTMLLFPAEGAAAPHELPAPPPNLIVLDGTWPQARKLLERNPTLAALPRLGLVPRRPGNYRIRREPAPHCVATVEAVVEVLAALEGGEERFQPMLAAFARMVDRQIEATAARTEPARRRLRPGWAWWVTNRGPDFERDRARLVVVAAEANAHRKGTVEGDPELVQLVARRVASGESLALLAAPRRPLAPGLAGHTGLAQAALDGAGPIADLLTRWRAFLRPEDLLCTWGCWARTLLAREGCAEGEWVDLRPVLANRLKRRPGYPDAARRALGAPAHAPWAPGRAAAMAADLAGLVDRLGEETAAGRARGETRAFHPA